MWYFKIELTLKGLPEVRIHHLLAIVEQWSICMHVVLLHALSLSLYCHTVPISTNENVFCPWIEASVTPNELMTLMKFLKTDFPLPSG